MSVPTEQRERAIAAARARESKGYFVRVAAGDQEAASLFVRLVALDLNPNGVFSDFGWLSKSPGEAQVDGFAEDAICWTSNPGNLENVLDMVNSAGAPGASLPSGLPDVKERRTNNLWVKPQPLTDEQMDYLLAGGEEQQPDTPGGLPSYEQMGGDEGGKKVTRLMEADYKRAEKPGLDGDSGAWQWRTAYDFIAGTFQTVEESIAKHQPEWRAALNQERAQQGKPPIAW